MVTPGQKGRIGVTVMAVASGADFVKNMLLPAGQTVGFAVQASGVRAALPQFATAQAGVCGRKVAPEYVLVDGDRVELYLPCDEAALKKARGLAQERRIANRSGGQAAEKRPENKSRLPRPTPPG